MHKILTTNNKIYHSVKYKTNDTKTDVNATTGTQAGICRTMVLTWIKESTQGCAMNNMAQHLTGGSRHHIAFLHRAIQSRLGHAVDKAAVVEDVFHGMRLSCDPDKMEIKTATLGMYLTPDDFKGGTDAAYVLITLGIGSSGRHALGLAFNIGGHHYMLDPNSGIFEYDTLQEMLGVLGHVTNYTVGNYSHLPDLQAQQISKLA